MKSVYRKAAELVDRVYYAGACTAITEAVGLEKYGHIIPLESDAFDVWFNTPNIDEKRSVVFWMLTKKERNTSLKMRIAMVPHIKQRRVIALLFMEQLEKDGQL